MRPANQQQAVRHMEYLLKRKVKGNRRTRVKEHMNRAKRIAIVIWVRFQVGPYQYQLKHLVWYLNTQTLHLKPATRYRDWLTLQQIIYSLNKADTWLPLFQGQRQKSLK